MLYALIVDEKVIETREFGVVPDPNPKKGLDWRPCSKSDTPRYNPETQVLVGPSYKVGDRAVIEFYTVRSKTRQELDAEAEAKLPLKDGCTFKCMFDQENRIRALEGKSPVTLEQYRELIKVYVMPDGAASNVREG